MSATEGIFVTGTGTEVGKTVVSAVIARTLASAGRKVAVFKPAVTGLAETAAPAADGPIPGDIGPSSAHRPPADHELLRFAAGSGQSDGEIAPYRYGPAASPHLAAALVGETIERERLLDTVRTAAAGAEALVCEGVGGLLVPLSPDYLVRDLAVDLGLPLVVVASPGLGTINHTLLTIESTRAAGLEVVAVVLTPWPDEPTEIEQSNRETIATRAEVPVHLLPPLDLSDPPAWPPLQVPMGRFPSH
jgi:dethiobiotin synthetase